MGLALARAYGHVVTIDCTYKTNRYRMPLLHIVSSAATNQSYTIAYGFLRTETTDQYTRAMHAFKGLIGVEGLPTKVVVTDHEVALIKALQAVFPDWMRLLCRWHITGNIVASARHKTPDDIWQPFLQRWKLLTRSFTEAIWMEGIEKMDCDYGDASTSDEQILKAWEYCKDKLENAEFFVACYTDRHLNPGEVNTSRVEGSHSAMKTRLRTATGNLLHAVSAISRYASRKEKEVLQKIDYQKAHRTVRQGKLFDNVSTNFTAVSSNAI
jgi:hypothetical protein